MMRGKYNWAVAVRKPNGTIHVEEHDLISGKDKNSWMYKPVVRGCTALVESLALGYRALEIASQYAFEELEDPEEGAAQDTEHDTSETPQDDENATRPAVADEHAAECEAVDASAPTNATNSKQDTPQVQDTQHSSPNNNQEQDNDTDSSKDHGKDNNSDASDSGVPKSLMTASMLIGLLLGVGIFIVLPAFVTNLIIGDYAERTLLWNIVDGLLRVAIFVFYIWLIGRLGDIKRMFSYHGAEHKTIHCYEHGLELTARNAQRFPTLHVRCGTAFMLMTMIIAIVVFTVVPVQWLIDAMGIENALLRLVVVIISRIILLPLVAGLSYEITVKWAGSRPTHPLVRVILWPGLQLQRLTTNEPDNDMIECAIQAMLCILKREELEAAKLSETKVVAAQS
jgi:uncharacterized protein YqhQ